MRWQDEPRSQLRDYAESFVTAWSADTDLLDCDGYDPEYVNDLVKSVFVWRMGDPRIRETTRRSTDMQRQWNIEARADFADKEKNDLITAAVRRAAVHINAEIALLLMADGAGQKPQVMAYSDDYFTGHAEIALLQDTLGDELAKHGSGETERPVSDELVRAFAQAERERNDG